MPGFLFTISELSKPFQFWNMKFVNSNSCQSLVLLAIQKIFLLEEVQFLQTTLKYLGKCYECLFEALVPIRHLWRRSGMFIVNFEHI